MNHHLDEPNVGRLRSHADEMHADEATANLDRIGDPQK
jgi:hypothetical protein